MTNETTHPDAVKLAELAIEMGEPIDEVERQLAGHVFTVGGFRCCTGFRASELLSKHARQKATAARTVARNRERTRQVVAKQHARIPRAFTAFSLEHTTIDVNPVPAVAAMTANAPADYAGSVMTKRPSRLDWLLGRGEGGGTFVPTQEERAAQAAARKANAATRKGKGSR